MLLITKTDFGIQWELPFDGQFGSGHFVLYSEVRSNNVIVEIIVTKQ